MVPGTVFAQWDEDWSFYSLRQVCRVDPPSITWLTLDWFSAEVPTDLSGLRPLPQDRYWYRGQPEYLSSSEPIPADWRELGVTAPLMNQEPTAYGSIARPSAASYERAWQSHDLRDREAFHAGLRDGGSVDINGVAVRTSTSMIRGESLLATPEELAQLPCIRHVIVDVQPADLPGILRVWPFLRTVTVTTPIPVLDLPSGVQALTLEEGASPDMRVSGAVTELTTDPSHLIDIAGLHTLRIDGVTDLDVSVLVPKYPHVRQLTLNGAPGLVSNLDALAGLPALRGLELRNVFGFDQIPVLSGLRRLGAVSISRKAGAQARKDYRHLNPTVSKLRSTGWLEANIDNPFRDWQGSQLVPQRYARAAWRAYAGHRAALRQVAATAEAGSSAEQTRSAVEREMEQVAAEFNAWDKRTGWIETDEREQICAVYESLLGDVFDAEPSLVTAGVEALDASREW